MVILATLTKGTSVSSQTVDRSVARVLRFTKRVSRVSMFHEIHTMYAISVKTINKRGTRIRKLKELVAVVFAS